MSIEGDDRSILLDATVVLLAVFAIAYIVWWMIG